jgi:hypothetical protein
MFSFCFFLSQESLKSEEAVDSSKSGKKDFHSSDLTDLKSAIASLNTKTSVKDIKNLKKELEDYEENLKDFDLVRKNS